MDVRHETATSQRAGEPGSDPTSYTPDVGRLTDWDQQLSAIAEEAIDLQQELSRLRDESEAVVQLLEQRERELEQKAELVMQLTDDRDRTETSMTAVDASLSEAQTLLRQERERIASLEQLLEQRQAELEHANTLKEELHSLRAHVVELQRIDARRAVVNQPRSHLRLVALPTGYALSESAEPPPRVGELIGIDGRQYAVASTGRSPLPGDERPCVLLLVDPSRTESPDSPDSVQPAARPAASR